MAALFGLDLTTSPLHPSAYAVISHRGQLASLGCAATDADIFRAVAAASPALVGIDAPLGLPWGLGCLEEPCTCGHCPPGPAKIRGCELELRRRLGIGCFYTTRRSIIKGMVYRGMALKRRLSEVGYAVLEVYPFASRVRLWGKPPHRKHSRAGRACTHQRLRELISGLPEDPLGHDEADALLAAYTCLLRLRSQSEMVGDPEEGQICVPQAPT